MNTPDKQYSDGRIELKGILSEFREALEEEIDKIKKSGQSSTLLYAGRQIESVGSEFGIGLMLNMSQFFPLIRPVNC